MADSTLGTLKQLFDKQLFDSLTTTNRTTRNPLPATNYRATLNRLAISRPLPGNSPTPTTTQPRPPASRSNSKDDQLQNPIKSRRQLSPPNKSFLNSFASMVESATVELVATNQPATAKRIK